MNAQIFIDYHNRLQALVNVGTFNLDSDRLELMDIQLNSIELENLELDFVAIVRSTIREFNCKECFLNYSLLFENQLEGVILNTCSIDESELRDSTMIDVEFINCTMNKIQWTNCKVYRSVIRECDLSWAHLNGIIFEECVLEKVNFSGSILNNVQFINCTVEDCVTSSEFKIKLVNNQESEIHEFDNLQELILFHN